ncbi:unnamed protein product [Allacma fusca]|uniref:Peptidase S1 domain-containing protein n=1 Tax=Allacma fusca TaxID=39272 RepID=A0A8J2JZZ7_9HEXA|nr:unnamed protein product [Allacma fusca]
MGVPNAPFGEISPNIAGGVNAVPGDFPNQVELQINNTGKCSGILLTSYLVLTVAHCFKSKTPSGNLAHFDETQVKVVAGKLSTKEISVSIKHIILHQEFDPYNMANDIALLELETPIDAEVHTEYGLLPHKTVSKRLSDYAIVSGWGRTEKNEPSKMLQKMNVTVYTDNVCISRWGKQFLDGMTCAGGLKEDTCKGVSGGPLTCTYGKKLKDEKVICGITSFGVNSEHYNKSCGELVQSNPGIYTNVSKYYNWIMSTSCDIRKQRQCHGAFPCCNGLCVPWRTRNDGYDDCGDGSDEQETTNAKPNEPPTCDLIVECPNPNIIFTAISPKFAYPYSKYRMSIFLQGGLRNTTKYAFTAWIDPQNFRSHQPGETPLELQEGETGHLAIDFEHVYESIYSLRLKVMNVNTTETFYYEKYIAAEKNLRVLIHTDKAIYGPQDTVYYRIKYFNTIPVKDKDATVNATATVCILDAKGNLIKKHQHEIKPGSHFDGEIHISDTFNPGTWNITLDSVFAMSDTENIRSSHFAEFIVRKRPQQFSVSVDVPIHIATEHSTSFPMKVQALYDDGTGVYGTYSVKIWLKVQGKCPEETSIRNNFIIGTHGINSIDFGSILNDDHANGAELFVEVTVTDSLTGHSVKKVETIQISRFDYKILPFSMNNYKRPNLPFLISFRAVSAFNQPLEPNREDHIQIIGHNFDRKAEVLNQTIGDAHFKFEAHQHQCSHFVNVTFRDLRYQYEVPTMSSNGSEFLQIRVLEPILDNNQVVPGTQLKLGPNATLVVFTYIGQVFISDSLNFKSMQKPTSKKCIGPGQTLDLVFPAPSNASIYIYGAEELTIRARDDFMTHNWAERQLESTNRVSARDNTNGFDDLKLVGMTVITDAAAQTAIHGQVDCRNATRCSKNVPVTDFPLGDTWISTNMISQNDTNRLTVTMPQKLSSWAIRGYYSKDGEHLEVPVFIHNTWTGTVHRDVTLTIKNLDIAFEFPSNSNISIPCAPNSVTETAITIKLVKTGIINIRVDARSDSEETFVEKSLIVLTAKEARSYIASSIFLAFPIPVNSSQLKSFIIGLGNPPVIPSVRGIAAKNGSKKELRTPESWKLFVSSDIMTLITNHVNRLVMLPSTSLETKVLRLAANIAILTYIPKTMQAHTEYRERAVISLERDYQNLLSTRCSDGSFTDGNPKSNCPGSIELTARIVRYLILAKSHTFVDDQIVQQGLAFLKAQLPADLGENHISLQKDSNSRIASIALTLLAFLEDQRSNSNPAGYKYLSTMEQARKLFQQYYNNNLKGNPKIHDARAQALMTYAEHVWNEVNPNKNTAKDKYWFKLSPKKLANGTTWFGTPEVKVETISYIILTSHLRGKHFDAIYYLNQILLRELNQYGGFLSTMDTEVAVMALAKVAEIDRRFATQFQLNISAVHRGVDYTNVAAHVEMNQSLAFQEFPLPRNTKGVKLEANGTGLVFAQLRHTYTVPRKSRKGSFTIEVKKTKSEGRRRSLNICIRFRKEGTSGVTVLDVNLPSGYKFEQLPTSESARKMSDYRSHEFVDINSKLRIVMGSLSNSSSSCVDVNAIRVFRVEERQPSFVQAYEFFDTTKVSQIVYELKKEKCPGALRCCNGLCVPWSTRNDGYDDCGDGSDEQRINQPSIFDSEIGVEHRDVMLTLKNSDSAFEFTGNSLAKSKRPIPCAPTSVTKRTVTIKLVKLGVVSIRFAARSDSDEALVEKSLLVIPITEVRRYIASSVFKALPAPVSSSHLKTFLIDLDNPAVNSNAPGNAAKNGSKSEIKDEGRRHSVIICIGLRRKGTSGLTVLDMNLPSGYKFEQVPTSGSLRQMNNHRSHEFVDMNSKLRIVLGSVSQTPRSCVDVKVFRVFLVEELKPSFVQAYAFFDTTNVSQIIYNI